MRKLLSAIKGVVELIIDSAAEKVIEKRMSEIDKEIKDIREHQKKLHRMTYHLYYPYGNSRDYPYDDKKE